MKFNCVNLEEKHMIEIDSFLMYMKLTGYSTDYFCLFDNNLKRQNDCIYIHKKNEQFVLVFDTDNKIKIHQENMNSDAAIFDIDNLSEAFLFLYKTIGKEF